MAFTSINSEDRLVQETFAAHLRDELGWESVYAWNQETFGPDGTLGRADTRDVVLVRDLRSAVIRLNPELPEKAVDDAIEMLTRQDVSRSTLQNNRTFHDYIRNGVPVSYRDAQGRSRHASARVIDFRHPEANRFLCVRELEITGLRTPNYNRRANLVCFVNGLPLVFIELKAVYVNIRAGFDGNLRDYLDEHVIAHAFHHNAFLVVSNGHRARYGSITSQWDHFAEWKRQDERDAGNLEAEVLLNGMLAKDRSPTRWTLSTPPMRRSVASRFSPARSSRVSRRCCWWSRRRWPVPSATTTSRWSTRSSQSGVTPPT